MERYLKKKRTMNECTRDLCSNDDEYKQLFNAEQLVKAGNIPLPTIVFTPKRSKEIYSLEENKLTELFNQISEKINVLKMNPSQSNLKVPNPFDTDLQLVEIDLDEKRQEIDRVKFIKEHSHYYPILSTIDFDMLRHKMTVYAVNSQQFLKLLKTSK